jgi:hypothetical protein
MQERPQELRWEAERLLFGAKNAADEAQRKFMLARALELASKAEMQEKQARGD